MMIFIFKLLQSVDYREGAVRGVPRLEIKLYFVKDLDLAFFQI